MSSRPEDSGQLQITVRLFQSRCGSGMFYNYNYFSIGFAIASKEDDKYIIPGKTISMDVSP
jgi:hypothetical protein